MLARRQPALGPPALAPVGAGSVCTSSGKIRCETPRLRIALLSARFTSSAWRVLGEHRSGSTAPPCRRRPPGRPPGTRRARAPGCRPGRSAPAPARGRRWRPTGRSAGWSRRGRRWPGRPPAGRSACRRPRRRRRRRPRGGCRSRSACPASSWRRSASARPRFEWPTMPKTWRTPQLTMVSAITSVTVRDVRRLGREADVDAVVAHLDREGLDAVVEAPGALPVSGSKSQPCHGQRSRPFSIEPSPSGPPWCGQRLSSAPYSALEVGHAQRRVAAGHRLDPALGQLVGLEDLAPDQLACPFRVMAHSRSRRLPVLQAARRRA